MSATTSAERLVFVDRLMTKSWLFRGAFKSLDTLACCALDVIDASWDVMKDPVTEVFENAAFSSVGQFTIGCLETGVNITANVLDAVLPVGDMTKAPKSPKENMDKGSKRSSKPDIVKKKKKMVTIERKSGLFQPIRTASASLVLGLLDVKAYLRSLKLDDDTCGHCTKRRKVIAPRRLGSHGLTYGVIDLLMAPLKLTPLDRFITSQPTSLTLSRNENVNKSPVRPLSATEKRKYLESDSTDDEDVRHTFHDDLDDYKSDDDDDYKPPEKDDSTDSDEYAEGETESDISIGEASATPITTREARKGANVHTLNGHAKESDKGKKPNEKDTTKKAADKPDNKDKTENKSAKKPETPKGTGTSVDKQIGNVAVVNGQKSGGKDSGKVVTDGKKGMANPIKSPLRMVVGK
ncbi:uncharacterized protein [Amphiura filiformis]|uniref:uncharacterized protein n=1 Tax=Amphiura filiformis TaxID=82378 RepID=UPI003B20FD81